ncbi:catechol O-methyltransferase-like [Genypterus blacodes]|uniref:catechol O-methyltransferase-like n=1 Tax=Genypterus blacodes TaxID=154954 RepID=UPI003F765861
MWLVVASVPLIPAVLMVSACYRLKLSALCHRAVTWALRLVRRRVCVKSNHKFVFSQCTHGNAESVLETFDLYAETHGSVCIGPQIGEALDEVLRRVRPSRVLELGTHCGYSSVRVLRLLPPAGKLITVELDPITADFGEEVILVAGFKHSQFQVLSCSSAEAISSLHPLLKSEDDTESSVGLNLVLMDHDPQHYLPDLWALEREDLLCPSGCSVLLINRSHRAHRETLDHIRMRSDCFCIRNELQFMTELFYQKEGRRAC